MMPDNSNTAAYRSRPSTKLRDILMSDKPTLSYADFHHQITRNSDSYLPHSFESQQMHGAEENAKRDELVRYMSNLPSYLEKGKNFQEKPLNVGVLDWRRLEKWTCNNNPMPPKNSGYSPSTSSTSYFSTEGSSSHSSRGQSSSPSRQRMHRSSLQSHLEASPMKACSHKECYSGRGHSYSPAQQRTCSLVPQPHHPKVYPWTDCSPNVDLTKENGGEFESSTSIPDHRIRPKNLCGMHQTCAAKESGVSLEMHKKKEFDSTTTSETGKHQSWGSSDVVSSRKGKLKIRESELKEAMRSRIPGLADSNPDCSKERRTVVLLLPRDAVKNRVIAHSSDPASSANQMPKESGGKCSSEQNIFKEVHSSDLPSNVPYTRPLPLQDDSQKKSEMRETRPTSKLGVKVPSEQIKSPSRSRNIEEKTSIVVLKSSTSVHISGQLDNRTSSQPNTKGRHPSPIRRLGSAMGNIIRSAGSRENSPLRRSTSKDYVSKPSSDRAADSVSLNADKSQVNGRARSSPLRRLLDPLIKPKGANAYELAEPLRKDSAPTAGPGRSSHEQYTLPKAQSVKVKSTSIDAKTKGAKDSQQNVKTASSPLQALLQVAVKNGLPLFTFAVDNSSDNILAATLRKCNDAEKNRSSWIYTFFAVHEMKKKNALWPSQSKGKGHFVHNAVAQMTVSDCQAPSGTREKCAEGDSTREFTLFSVDVGQADQQATEFQPTIELAAIVVKLIKETAGSTPSDVFIDPSQKGSERSPMSTTVILPGGVHTIPSKGSISTLTERWRSGGTCDCGGWDLGCQLRIFTNQGDSQKILTSSKATDASDEFKLYHQVGQETELVLSLNPFKDRIYSVEFDSSVSLLQAFATSIAVLDCRRSSGLFGASNVINGRSSTSLVSGDPARARESNQSYLEAPASYVSCPPHSPVGRV